MDTKSDKKPTNRLKVDPEAIRRLEYCIRKWASLSQSERESNGHEVTKKQQLES